MTRDLAPTDEEVEGIGPVYRRRPLAPGEIEIHGVDASGIGYVIRTSDAATIAAEAWRQDYRARRRLERQRTLDAVAEIEQREALREAVTRARRASK